MPTKHRLMLLLCISVLLVGCAGAPRQPLLSQASLEPLNVQFAGFAYMGDEQSIADNYPLTLSLNTIGPDGVSRVDNIIKKRLLSMKPQYLNLHSDLTDVEQGEGISMALTIDRETVAVEKIDGKHKLLVELGFQVLFFDFQAMSIIGSYPITLQYIDVLSSAPTKKHIQAIVKGALTGEFYNTGFKNHISQEFATLLAQLQISKKQGNHLQVTSVTINDKAKRDLPDHLQQTRNAQNYIAQSFAKYLSLNQGVSVLPFTKGYAIGNRMSARFSNGEVFDLIVPEPDYGIEIVLRGFKKKLHDQISSAQSFIYGAYFTLVVSQPLTKKVYLDEQFVRASTQVIPARQTQVADWPIFEGQILNFFNSLTLELSNPTSAWARRHTGKTATISGLKKFKTIVEQCK